MFQNASKRLKVIYLMYILEKYSKEIHFSITMISFFYKNSSLNDFQYHYDIRIRIACNQIQQISGTCVHYNTGKRYACEIYPFRRWLQKHIIAHHSADWRVWNCADRKQTKNGNNNNNKVLKKIQSLLDSSQPREQLDYFVVFAMLSVIKLR